MNEGVTSGHCCEYYVVAITTARWRTERERERGNIINAQALGVTWKVLTTTFRLGLAANTAKFTQFTPSTLKTTTYKKKKKTGSNQLKFMIKRERKNTTASDVTEGGGFRQLDFDWLPNPLGAVGANDVTNGRPADGAQAVSGGAGAGAVQLQGALVAETHVTARVQHAVDAPLVADGALAAGTGALCRRPQRQRVERFDVGRRGRRQRRRRSLVPQRRHFLVGWCWCWCLVVALRGGRWRCGRRLDGAQQADGSGAAVDVENGP